MRKLFILAIIVLIAATLGHSQSITVQRPNATDIWKTGETHDIIWLKPGVTDPIVKITLWAANQSSPTLVIEANAPNIGNFKWKIPATVQTGKYRVKVKVKDKEIGGLSAIFDIKREIKLVQVPQELHTFVKIIQPTTGTDWLAGNTHLIQWENAFTKDKAVKIELYNYNGTQFVYSITSFKRIYVGNPPLSSFSWTIPEEVFVCPGNFTIKITTIDGKASGTSQMFHISPKIETLTPKLPD